MGELLDLILEFEKKLLSLIKDLALHPKKIADSIVSKDKIYLGAFKFYTLATSAWIIFFQLGNSYFDFFSTEFQLPERLVKYLQSEQDFAFLIAPFAGLVEFFIPFALINWFLFRKRELSWLNHITLNIYIAGFLLIYALPWFLILFVLSTLTWFDGDMINIIAYVSVIIAPVFYYCWVYLKVFGRKKFLSFAKPLCTIITISYLSISFFLNQPFHELIHRKIFYSKYNQFNLVPTKNSSSYTYTRLDSLVYETPDNNHFAADLVNSSTYNANAFVVANYDRKLMNYSYNLIIITANSKKIIPLHSHSFSESQFFSVSQIDSMNQFIVLHNNLSTIYSDTLRLISVNQFEPPRLNMFTDHLNVLSSIIKIDSSFIFSGILQDSKEPVLGKLNATNEVQGVYTFQGKKNFHIDLTYPGNQSTFQWLMSHDDVGRLKEIIWMQGYFTTDGLKQMGKISLYKNEFSPTKNFFNGFLHNSKLTNLNDSTSIATFQIMTDSSFAISISNINTKQKKEDWNSIISVPSDLAFNDELLADSSHIYLLGRSASIFQKGLSQNYYQLPYLMKVNRQTGQSDGIEFLEMERDWTGYYLPNLESIYTMPSSAYQDQQYIYWIIGGQHYYKIDKTKL